MGKDFAKTLLEKAIILPPEAMCCAACASTRKVPRKLIAITLSKVATSPPSDGKKRHDSCKMDNYVDAAKDREGLLEEILHVRRVGDVRLHSDGLSARGL